MMNAKKRFLSILLAGAMVLSAGISSLAEETSQAEETETAQAADSEGSDTCTSYLTGLTVPTEIGRKRPISLMFNNITDGLPQCGIENCGVLVEAEVEGLITRIMGITEDYQSASRIGSIRSARNYYFYFAKEFQSVYTHYGEAAYALPLLRLSDTMDLDGLGDEGSTVFFRVSDRVSPHNAFTDYDHIQAGIAYKGFDMNYPSDYNGVFKFASEEEPTTNENGTDASLVSTGYPYNNAQFTYNADDGLYYRSQFGEAQTDGNSGEQLTCKNIILQYCDSTSFDDNGYLWTDVTGSGTGKFITNGKCIDVTWKHDMERTDDSYIVDIQAPNISVPVYYADFSVTRYYDADGNEIQLNPGKTWICLIRNSAADSVSIQ